MSELSGAWGSKAFVNQSCLPRFELHTTGLSSGREINSHFVKPLLIWVVCDSELNIILTNTGGYFLCPARLDNFNLFFLPSIPLNSYVHEGPNSCWFFLCTSPHTHPFFSMSTDSSDPRLFSRLHLPPSHQGCTSPRLLRHHIHHVSPQIQTPKPRVLSCLLG